MLPRSLARKTDRSRLCQIRFFPIRGKWCFIEGLFLQHPHHLHAYHRPYGACDLRHLNASAGQKKNQRPPAIICSDHRMANTAHGVMRPSPHPPPFNGGAPPENQDAKRAALIKGRRQRDGSFAGRCLSMCRSYGGPSTPRAKTPRLAALPHARHVTRGAPPCPPIHRPEVASLLFDVTGSGTNPFFAVGGDPLLSPPLRDA